MAKDEPELPQGAPEAELSLQSAVPTTPTVGTKQDNESRVDTAVGWWEKQKEPRVSHLAVTIIVAIFGILISVLAVGTGVLWDRWTDEMGEHRKTMDRAVRAEQRVSDLISERDKLRQLVSEQQQRITHLEKLSLFLKFLGPRTKLVRSFDLPKEAGQVLDWGDCPKDQIRTPSSDSVYALGWQA